MLKDLVKVASRLDSLGLSSEADFIDAVVRKFAHREEVYGLDTSKEEAFEDGRRTPYKGRDGGHKRGPREDKFRYNPEELSPPIEEGAGEEYLEGFSYEDLSNDAMDGRSRRRAKYPPFEYDRLDSLGLSSEAHFIDAVVRKFAGDLVQFPKEVWQDRPKMKAKDIRAEKKRHFEEWNAHQRKLEEDMRAQDEENYSSLKGRHEYPSEEEMAREEEAYLADLEENKLNKPYSSDVDISSSGIGSGKGRGERGRDAYNMRGDLMGSKAPRRSKNRGISTPFDDDDFSDDADDMFDLYGNLIDPTEFEQGVGDEDFDQYDNPEETFFRRNEPVGPGRRRGRSVYVPSDETLDRELEQDQDPSNWTDRQWAEYESTAGPNGRGVHSNDANDMQRLAKRLASLGLIKEARTLISIVKSANDDFYTDEETDEPSHYSEDEAIESIDNRKNLINALNRMDDRTFYLLRVTYPEAMEAILQKTEGERQTPEQIHKRKLRENSNVNKYYSNK